MKYIHTSIYVLISIISLHSQGTYIDANFISSCSSDGSGDIELNFTTAALEDYDLPFEAEWENLTNGEYSTFTINEVDYQLDNLELGEYEIIIYLDKYCTIMISGAIEQVSPTVNVIFIENNSECLVTDSGSLEEFSCDGSIDIEVSNMTGALSYEWENLEDESFYSSDEDPSNLCPGLYSVTVVDENGCKAGIDKIRVCCCASELENMDFDESCYPPTDLPGYSSLSISVKDYRSPDNATSNNGWIDISIEHSESSTPDIYYYWEGPNGFTAYTEDIRGLSPGEYCVVVTDGCTSDKACVELLDCSSNQMSLQANILTACSGYDVGAIQLNVNGGQAPYSFKWSNHAVSQSISNLSAGTYCVTVEDKGHCLVTDCYDIKNGTITENREDCVITTRCDNQIVNVNDLGMYGVPDANDCDYVKFYCNDGVYLGRKYYGSYIGLDPDDCAYYSRFSSYNNQVCEKWIGRAPINYYFQCNSCEIIAKCEDGSIYDIMQGVPNTISYSGVNPYYC